jgi:hypothetical protein
MKEFLIIAIAFILFLLLRIAKNQLSNTHKLIISLVFVGALSFGIISRSIKHFNGVSLIILAVFIILLSLKLIIYLKHKN